LDERNQFFNNRRACCDPRRVADAGLISADPSNPRQNSIRQGTAFFFRLAGIIRERRPQGFRNLTVPTDAEIQGDFSRSAIPAGARQD